MLQSVINQKRVKIGLQFLTELTKVVSPPILEKLCLHNITFFSLVTTYKNGGQKAITGMLSETTENKSNKKHSSYIKNIYSNSRIQILGSKESLENAS